MTQRETHSLASTGEQFERKSFPSDATISRLFCLWMLLQCFFYEALPAFRWSPGIGIRVTPDKLALLALLVAVSARLIRSDDSFTSSPRAARQLGYMLIGFAAVCVTSWWVIGADSGSLRFAELTRVCSLSVFPAFAYFAARMLRYTRPMLKDLLRFFAVFGVYLSVTAIAEHYNIAALVYPTYILDPTVGVQFGRSRGPFANTIGNGGMLVVSFAAYACIFASLTGRKRFVMLFFTLLSVLAVYFTETRSVWLSLAVLTMTLLTLGTSLRKLSLTVIGVLAVAFVLGVGSKFSIFDQTLFSRRQNTVEYRLDNYRIAWNAFKANPIFGLGFGRFRTEWNNYAALRHLRFSAGLDDGNHSTALGILADLGLAGAIPFGGIVVFASWVCYKSYRSLNHHQAMFERMFVVVAIGALEVFLVLGLTSDLRTSPTVNITAFWFVGVISSVASAWHPSAHIGTPQKPQAVLAARRSVRLGLRQSV